MTILSWISVRPIMRRMMPQPFARCKIILWLPLGYQCGVIAQFRL